MFHLIINFVKVCVGMFYNYGVTAAGVNEDMHRIHAILPLLLLRTVIIYIRRNTDLLNFAVPQKLDTLSQRFNYVINVCKYVLTLIFASLAAIVIQKISYNITDCLHGSICDHTDYSSTWTFMRPEVPLYCKVDALRVSFYACSFLSLYLSKYCKKDLPVVIEQIRRAHKILKNIIGAAYTISLPVTHYMASSRLYIFVYNKFQRAIEKCYISSSLMYLFISCQYRRALQRYYTKGMQRKMKRLIEVTTCIIPQRFLNPSNQKVVDQTVMVNTELTLTPTPGTDEDGECVLLVLNREKFHPGDALIASSTLYIFKCNNYQEALEKCYTESMQRDMKTMSELTARIIPRSLWNTSSHPEVLKVVGQTGIESTESSPTLLPETDVENKCIQIEFSGQEFNPRDALIPNITTKAAARPRRKSTHSSHRSDLNL